MISRLQKYKNTERDFYKIRAKDWHELEKEDAAARMIYLNKTCFNGLYRVNRSGEFNTSYGKNPDAIFCDPERIRAAAKVLKKKKVLCSDYRKVLKKYAEPGDFIFWILRIFRLLKKRPF